MTLNTPPSLTFVPPVQMERGLTWDWTGGPNLHQPYLRRAALIVSHAGALGALEGCAFGGDGVSEWGDPAALSAGLMTVYDGPQAAQHLGLLRRAWQASNAQLGTPGVGPEGPWQRWQEIVDATSFPPGHRPPLLDAGAGQAWSREDVVLNELFLRLIRVADDWLAEQRHDDGVRHWPAGNVARSAAFAYLHLSALADAQPGQPLHVRGEEEVAALAWRVACGLVDQAGYSRLKTAERQAMGGVFVLMPMFLAAAYEYGHLSDDEGAQALAAELACEELHTFFGVQRLRPDLSTLSSLHLGEL